MASKATEGVKQDLIDSVHSIINAANARNFDITSPPWHDFAHDFNALPGLLDKPPGTMTLGHFLPWFEEMCKRHSTFSLKIIDIKVEVKDRCHAECFTSLEYNGLPTGVSRPGVATFDFLNDEQERWRCSRLVTLGGLLGDGGDLRQ